MPGSGTLPGRDGLSYRVVRPMDEPADDPDVHPDRPADDGPPIPARRRSWFDRPLFWLGLVAAGVVLAVSLSFAAERTDLSGTVGDVGMYCQQVGVVRGIASEAALDPRQGGVERATALVAKLKALEAVAPAPVHDDVTVVRQSAETLLGALGEIQNGSAGARSATLQDVSQAVSAGQGAIHDMTEYTQEACGIDLGSPDTTGGAPASPTTSTTR